MAASETGSGVEMMRLFKAFFCILLQKSHYGPVMSISPFVFSPTTELRNLDNGCLVLENQRNLHQHCNILLNLEAFWQRKGEADHLFNAFFSGISSFACKNECGWSATFEG